MTKVTHWQVASTGWRGRAEAGSAASYRYSKQQDDKQQEGPPCVVYLHRVIPVQHYQAFHVHLPVRGYAAQRGINRRHLRPSRQEARGGAGQGGPPSSLPRICLFGASREQVENATRFIYTPVKQVRWKYTLCLFNFSLAFITICWKQGCLFFCCSRNESYQYIKA